MYCVPRTLALQERHDHFYRFLSPVWLTCPCGVVGARGLAGVPPPRHARLSCVPAPAGFTQHGGIFRHLLSGAAPLAPTYPAPSHGACGTLAADTVVDAGKDAVCRGEIGGV